MSYDSFLTALVEAVMIYGTHGVKLISNPETKEFGFEIIPNGEKILIDMDELEKYFSNWNRTDIIRTHVLMVEDAMSEGERLRKIN